MHFVLASDPQLHFAYMGTLFSTLKLTLALIVIMRLKNRASKACLCFEGGGGFMESTLVFGVWEQAAAFGEF